MEGRNDVATYRIIKPYGKPLGIVTRNDDTRRTMVDKI